MYCIFFISDLYCIHLAIILTVYIFTLQVLYNIIMFFLYMYSMIFWNILNKQTTDSKYSLHTFDFDYAKYPWKGKGYAFST